MSIETQTVKKKDVYGIFYVKIGLTIKQSGRKPNHGHCRLYRRIIKLSLLFL